MKDGGYGDCAWQSMMTKSGNTLFSSSLSIKGGTVLRKVEMFANKKADDIFNFHTLHGGGVKWQVLSIIGGMQA